MKINLFKTAQFIRSVSDYEKLGYDRNIEFAFIGRSNVGKSSLINTLTRKKNLALTSSTPGKTRTINLFLIDEKWNIVDLPGYGYAQRSKSERLNWSKIISDYIVNRKNLACLFILVDANIPPQKIDIEFINNCGAKNIPLSIVFTKTDKSNKSLILKNIEAFRSELGRYWEELPRFFLTSAANMNGITELSQFIEQSMSEIKSVQQSKNV